MAVTVHTPVQAVAIVSICHVMACQHRKLSDLGCGDQMAYAQVSNQLLSHTEPLEIESELRELRRQLGEVHTPNVRWVEWPPSITRLWCLPVKPT